MDVRRIACVSGLAALVAAFLLPSIATAQAPCLPGTTRPICVEAGAGSVNVEPHVGWAWWGSACGKLTARSYAADGSKLRVTTAFDSRNPDGPIAYCHREAGTPDWWQGSGFGIEREGVAYTVVRLQARSALTGQLYDLYASSDDAHSTVTAWTGGPGRFPDRWCVDWGTAPFPERC